MKWSEAEEFSQYCKRIMNNFSKENEFIIFGTGEACINLIETLGDNLKIKYFIDSNESKHNKLFFNMTIYPPDILLNEDKNNTRIIITPGGDMYSQIVSSVEKMGFKKQNYCGMDEILTLWSWFYNKKIVVSFTSIMLTSLCTLKCKGCAPYIPYFKKKSNIGLDEIKKSIDNAFKTFDYISNLQVAGGEPFLHNELDKICEYIYMNYNKQYSRFSIVTNGTIIPKDNTLFAMKKSKILVYISDYSNTIGEKSKIVELVNALTTYKISYVLESGFGKGKENEYTWFNMGNPNVHRNLNDDQKKELFNKCSLYCRVVEGDRWYYCNPVCGATVGGLYNSISKNDYLDLKEINNKQKKDFALDIIKFNLGYLDLGYVTFCDRCNGFGIDVNPNLIPAGEQIELLIR